MLLGFILVLIKKIFSFFMRILNIVPRGARCRKQTDDTAESVRCNSNTAVSIEDAWEDWNVSPVQRKIEEFYSNRRANAQPQRVSVDTNEDRDSADDEALNYLQQLEPTFTKPKRFLQVIVSNGQNRSGQTSSRNQSRFAVQDPNLCIIDNRSRMDLGELPDEGYCGDRTAEDSGAMWEVADEDLELSVSEVVREQRRREREDRKLAHAEHMAQQQRLQQQSLRAVKIGSTSE